MYGSDLREQAKCTTPLRKDESCDSIVHKPRELGSYHKNEIMNQHTQLPCTLLPHTPRALASQTQNCQTHGKAQEPKESKAAALDPRLVVGSPSLLGHLPLASLDSRGCLLCHFLGISRRLRCALLGLHLGSLLELRLELLGSLRVHRTQRPKAEAGQQGRGFAACGCTAPDRRQDHKAGAQRRSNEAPGQLKGQSSKAHCQTQRQAGANKRGAWNCLAASGYTATGTRGQEQRDATGQKQSQQT